MNLVEFSIGETVKCFCSHLTLHRQVYKQTKMYLILPADTYFKNVAIILGHVTEIQTAMQQTMLSNTFITLLLQRNTTVCIIIVNPWQMACTNPEKHQWQPSCFHLTHWQAPIIFLSYWGERLDVLLTAVQYINFKDCVLGKHTKCLVWLATPSHNIHNSPNYQAW